MDILPNDLSRYFLFHSNSKVICNLLHACRRLSHIIQEERYCVQTRRRLLTYAVYAYHLTPSVPYIRFWHLPSGFLESQYSRYCLDDEGVGESFAYHRDGYHHGYELVFIGDDRQLWRSIYWQNGLPEGDIWNLVRDNRALLVIETYKNGSQTFIGPGYVSVELHTGLNRRANVKSYDSKSYLIRLI